jgi:hypothetical protein
MRNVVFWDIKPQFVHHISATESSQLMLCQICGFHGVDYEECRLLGYKIQFVLHRRYITSPLYRDQPVNAM